jgi:DNA-binding LacI/PurR family transcriptional regulator
MAKITINEIAQQAGVSKTAVSFAFNDPTRLPQETVRRILHIANELGYIPNPIARSLTSNRTGNIGLLFPQPMSEVLGNPYMLELLRGVASICDADGYTMMLVSPLLGSMKQAVSSAAVDGFLTIGLEHYKSTVRLLDQREVPYVMVDSEPHAGAPCVNIDDAAGSYDAMNYVLEQGHRKIAILGIESGRLGEYELYVGTLQNRVAGYRRALAEYGLDIDGQAVRLIECACTREGGASGLAESFKESSPPTVIVAMADIIALGALEAATERGMRVPEALSVMGFDDLAFSQWANPPLTTVHQPVFEKGQSATRLLLTRLAGDTAIHHHVLPTNLVVRRSVAAPP